MKQNLPPLPRLPDIPAFVAEWLTPGARNAARAWAREYGAECARRAEQAERERIAAQWEWRHGFDKHGCASAIRSMKEPQ